MTFREALGGPWSTHWMVLVGSVAPATFLVLLQESTTPYPAWWWLLASAAIQHLIAGSIIVIGGSLARLRHDIIPLPTIFAVWALAAVCRGFAAGLIAERVANVDAQYSARVGIWILATIVWLPPMVFAIAHLERRRELLGKIEATERELHLEQPHTHETQAAIQRQLRHAVAMSLTPALDDLQKSLESTRNSLDHASVAELSLRLSRIHDTTEDILDSTTNTAPSLPITRVSMREALDVPPRLPWLSAALATGSTVALVIFDVWRIFGSQAALELIVSAFCAGLVMALVPVATHALNPRALEEDGQRVNAVGIVFGIAISSYLLLNSGIDPVTWHAVVIVPLFGVSFSIASAMYFSVIVLSEVNSDAESQLGILEAELGRQRHHNEITVARERERLAQLMHGPVQGRIAACIMALNFHAASDSNPAQTNELARAVIDHLHAVAQDLARITKDNQD